MTWLILAAVVFVVAYLAGGAAIASEDLNTHP